MNKSQIAHNGIGLPSPPTSEGPYRARRNEEDDIYEVVDADGNVVISDHDRIGAGNVMDALNTAHARATAEQAKKVEELVRAAKNMVKHIDSIEEDLLMELDNDKHPPSSTSCLNDAIRTALKGMETPAIQPTSNHGANLAHRSLNSLPTPD